MRTLLFVSLLVSGLPLAAGAAPPLYSDEEAPLPPVSPGAAAPAATPAPAPDADPAPPQPMYFNGPVYVIPAWPVPTAPPVYAPPDQAVRSPPAASPPAARPPAGPLGPRLGIGGRMTGMWINQRLYNSDMLMLGGGVLARLRVVGPLALEATFDVLKRDIHEGVFERTAYPVQLAALVSFTPPRQGTHFGVYGALGGGVLPSQVVLNDRIYPRQELRATEVMGQVGVGCELRVWRLSVSTDARAIGLLRTGDTAYFDSFIRPDSGPNSLGLRQAPVQDKSFGWTFSAAAMIWL